MNTEDFWKSKEINTFEKLLLVYLQFNEFKSVKELSLIFSVSEVTLRRAFAKLRKLELISKSGVSKLILNNNVCIKTDTKEKSECINIDTICIKSDTKSIKNDTFSKKHSLFINTDLINNTNSINSGKLSLTSFASASLEDYTVKFNSVNDPDHKELNSVHNSLIPTKTEKTSLAEVMKAPAKQKRTRKSSPFVPPTVEQVEIYMQQYVGMKKNKFPDLVLIDLAVNAEKFINYYEGKGWKIKNWKNAAGNWLITEMGYIQMGSSAPKKVTLEEIEQTEGESTNEINTVTIENEDGSLSVEAAPAEETEQEKERRRAEEMNKFLKEHNYGHDRL